MASDIEPFLQQVAADLNKAAENVVSTSITPNELAMTVMKNLFPHALEIEAVGHLEDDTGVLRVQGRVRMNPPLTYVAIYLRPTSG
jgi:hypothetical protein